MGLSSVTENSVYNYSINNYGNAPLVIDNIVFTQNGFSLQDSLPITINQYNNRNINIIYNGTIEGNFSALMKIYSNDPTHRLVDVNVSGNRFEPNELSFSVDTINYLQNAQVAVKLNNYSSITAVQFDFYYPKNYYNISSSDFVLSSTRCPSHSISTIALNDSVWRVLVFSMQNQNITGNNGALLNITMHPKTTTRQGIYRVRASGVILSNSAGINKLTGENPSNNFNVLIPTYTVSALSNNNSMGTISGAGVYNYLSTATLIATPNLHCIFLHWNDNNTNRTRNIIVSQDTSFTAYFKRIDTTYIRAEICQGSSYNFYGQTLTSTNNYSHTVIVGQYQDSVYILNLTVNQPKTTNLTASICQGQTYNLNGFNVSTAGLHTLNLQTTKGCDSTVNLTLTVNQPAITNLSDSICQGQTYNLNGFNTNTAGLHTLYLQTYKGCDSTVNLTLTVNQPATTNLSAEICQGQTYTLNGFNTSIAGLHTQNLQTYKGCDSTVNLTLTVNQPATTNLSASICQGETYTLNGFNTSTAGLHTQNLQTYKGCDSIVNLTLTVNQPTTTNLTAEICQGQTYTLNGFNTNTAGLNTLNLQTYKGCDSTVNLTLTVNQPITTNLTAEICQGETYTLNGFNTSNAGLHTKNLQTYKGCDSTVNLTLTINQNKTTNLYAVITQGDVYNQNGFNETNTGVYTHNLQTYKGCDSIVVLTLNVYPALTTNITADICQGQTYNLNGFNESIEGIYTHTLTGIGGIDSIVSLILIVNQPKTTNLTAKICQGETYILNGFNVSTAGLHTQNLQTYKGCDSTVNLNLTVNQPQITNIEAEICQGQTYNLNGFNISTQGLHTLNLQTYKGCDSTVNLTLTINQPAITNLTAEICQGETYTSNGFNVSTAGLHTLNLQTYKGCDSIVNLTLTVNQPAITNLTAEICQGETYTSNGFNVSTAGLHTLNLQTYKGCDSIVNLTLTVNQPATTNLSASICQGQTYTLNGFNVSTAGLHTLNLQTYKGCDSTVNLTLTVNQPKTTNLTAEVCQGETYTLNGFNVSTAGLHTQNLQTYKGCDSTVNLTLTVNQPATTNLTAEICQGQAYNLNGFNVSTAGLHTLNLQTIKGCDSTVNLTLNVNQPAITNLTAEICQGETYDLNGFSVNTAGIYNQNLQTINGCDSIVTLNLTVNELITPTNLALDNIANYFEFSWQGNGESYVIYRNNDSIATITETIYHDTNVIVGTNYCYKIKALNSTCESELSGEICQIFSGLNNIKNNKISATLYPNPTDNKAILEIEGLTNQYDVIVYDLHGRTIKSYKLNLGQKKLEIDVKGFANGVYNIKIVNDKNSITKKLIVR